MKEIQLRAAPSVLRLSSVPMMEKGFSAVLNYLGGNLGMFFTSRFLIS
jgi:hypothetical protein